jgi:hypothetical protein
VLHRAFRAAALAIVAVAFAVAAPAAADTVATARPSVQPGTVDPPPITVNPFIPEDRGISDCISALPKPGCGSEARGGWRQGLILLALVGGLSIIGWRIVAGVRAGSSAAGGGAGADPLPENDPTGAPPPPATMHAPAGQPPSPTD